MRLEDLNIASFDVHPYQTDTVVLTPYIKTRFDPGLMPRLHAGLVKDGTLRTVFSSMEDPEIFENWWAYMSAQPIVLFVKKPGLIIGAGWISQAEGKDGARKAAFGFWVYRESWGTTEAHDLCRFALKWWFEVFRVDILYATSLKTNRLAVNFALRRFGFQKLCDLPMFFPQDGQLMDATLICLKKEDFDVVYDRWRLGIQEPRKSFVNGSPDSVNLSA